jgi:acyl dehydratase
LYFEYIQVGQEWETGGRTVTEADVVNFAGISGDFNPIHMDHEFAKKSHFQRPIAHGLLVQAVASGLSVQIPLMRTLALMSMREWYYRGPVFIGDTIRVKTKVLEKESRGKGRLGVVTWERRIVNQNDKVVQEGVTITLVEARGTGEQVVV